MNKDITIQPITISQCIEAAQLLHLLMEDHAVRNPWYSSIDSASAHTLLSEEVGNSSTLLVGAFYEKKMIGIIRATMRNPADRSASYVRIHEIFVLPDFRSKGVAQELLESATEWTKALEVKRLELSVDIDNVIGVQFWEKENFKDYQRVMYKIV